VTIGDPSRSYDVLAGGGTTTLVIDPKTRELKHHLVSLSGSLQNCGGGATPWGSWISCEETLLGTDRFRDSSGVEHGGFAKNHGYCFEVFAAADELKESVPLVGLGRFIHEAVAVDPRSGIVYQTEDRAGAGFYRFVPNKREHLAEGGQLQMLAIRDRPQLDTRTGQKQGAKFGVTWVDIDDPDPAHAEDEDQSVYRQGLAKGGATFARLQGCWAGNGNIFFTTINAAGGRAGQVWKYTPSGNESGVLTFLYESSDVAWLDRPNNLCASLRGGLVLCENGGAEQFVRGLTSEGRIFDLARNMVPGFETQEFAGAAFSPDGQTLFFNLQTPGLTFAIWGPWASGSL
jgi:secreted PhoX family phosphatase